MLIEGDVATIPLSKESMPLFSVLFSYLERVGTCDICEWNEQSNTICLAFSSKRI